jgi:hypothetical protein
LTNIQGGHQSIIRGKMTVESVIEHYTKEEAEFQHKLILIDVNRSFGHRRVTRDSLLDAVRFMWRLNKRRASKSEYVLAQRGGVIIGVFQPEVWLDATLKNFPEFSENVRQLEERGGPKRIGFRGHEVTDIAVNSSYINKRIPAEYRQSPPAPCLYVNI